MGTVVLNGATSGSTTIQPTDAVTAVLTLPSTTGTLALTSGGGSPSFTTITTTNDASISGLTVGKGGGAVVSNSAFGQGALNNAGTGNYVTAIGYQSLYSNTTGQGGTAVGGWALYSNTTGTANTGIGGFVSTGSVPPALYSNTTGSYNIAVGTGALTSNTTASNNTAVGYQAGAAITTATRCTFVGGSAASTTTASDDTGIGYGVLGGTSGGVSGGNNIAVGSFALTRISSGAYNVAIGVSAGSNITTGAGLVIIGYNAQASAATDTNEIVIGNGAVGKGSNTGFINPNSGGVYQGNNSATWSTTSDQRLKKNIVDNTVGLSAISQIQVRNFEYRLAEEVTDLPKEQAIGIAGVQLGAIAQELQAVLPDCVKTESTGVMSVDTTNITWHLINAVKELNATVQAQSAQIAALTAKVGA